MKMGLLLILAFVTFETYGAFHLSPGVSFTLPHNSEELNEQGKEFARFKYHLGIDLDVEYSFWGPLSINVGAVWKGGEAVTQYQYQNKSNPLDAATVKDLKTRSSSITGLAGGRIRFINLDKLKSYVGGGLTLGRQYFTFDEDRFVLIQESKIGFKKKEDQEFKGHYYEGGIEFLNGKGGALRVQARQYENKTNAFETLNDHELSIRSTQFSIQYLHPF